MQPGQVASVPATCPHAKGSPEITDESRRRCRVSGDRPGLAGAQLGPLAKPDASGVDRHQAIWQSCSILPLALYLGICQPLQVTHCAFPLLYLPGTWGPRLG